MLGVTPKLMEVSVPRHGVLRLRFDDGVTGDVAVLDALVGPVFSTVRTREGFAGASLDRSLGTVVWPGGADVAPDVLYARLAAR